MLEFLYNTGRESYVSSKSSFSNGERNDFDQYLMMIDKNLVSLDRLNKDIKLINNELLDPSKKIVNPNMVTKTERGDWRMKTKDEILNELHIGVKQALKQSHSENERRDGMDIALCAWNEETNVLEFAGANRPLWIFRKNIAEEKNPEIIQEKPSRI